jgi:hypothetical protein
MRVIGAGVGRTGTVSLKMALERLLGGPCYHTTEVQRRPDHVPQWLAAIRGETPDWDSFLRPYVATTDWPAAAFWRQLHEAYPDALVLLSVRESVDAWWKSADSTINRLMQMEPDPGAAAWHAMALELLRTTFTPVPFERDAAIAAYEAHNAAVRDAIAPEQLLEWQVTDGWTPLCERLGVAVPAEPFPHANRGDSFAAFLDGSPRRPSLRELVRMLAPRTRRGR